MYLDGESSSSPKETTENATAAVQHLLLKAEKLKKNSAFKLYPSLDMADLVVELFSEVVAEVVVKKPCLHMFVDFAIFPWPLPISHDDLELWPENAPPHRRFMQFCFDLNHIYKNKMSST